MTAKGISKCFRIVMQRGTGFLFVCMRLWVVGMHCKVDCREGFSLPYHPDRSASCGQFLGVHTGIRGHVRVPFPALYSRFCRIVFSQSLFRVPAMPISRHRLSQKDATFLSKRHCSRHRDRTNLPGAKRFRFHDRRSGSTRRGRDTTMPTGCPTDRVYFRRAPSSITCLDRARHQAKSVLQHSQVSATPKVKRQLCAHVAHERDEHLDPQGQGASLQNHRLMVEARQESPVLSSG